MYMQQPFDVSVIIPVRNRPLLLGESIRSVFYGSGYPRELIVVIDDRPENGMLDLKAAEESFSRYGNEETQIQILYSNGRGPAAARNVGINSAKHTWLAFLDSDDIWREHKLSKQINYLSQRPHMLACQTLEIWLKNNRELTQSIANQPRCGRFLKDAFRRCLISASTVILHRQCFEILGLFDESFAVCEDFEFWLRYLSYYPMGLVRERLSVKRSGGWEQQSQKFHSQDKVRIEAILKTVQNQILRPDEWESARIACLEKLAILKRGSEKYGRPEYFGPLEQEIHSVFSDINI